MSERTSSKPGIADYVVARRKRKECFLDEIDRLIDWNPLEKLLRKTLKRVVNAVGNPAVNDRGPRRLTGTASTARQRRQYTVERGSAQTRQTSASP